MGTPEGDWTTIPSGACWEYDRFLEAWATKWTELEHSGKPAHVRKLLQYALFEERGDYKEYSYSFCCGDGDAGHWKDLMRLWHCPACKNCTEPIEWHCGTCKVCRFDLSVPCEGCGGVSFSFPPSEWDDACDGGFGYDNNVEDGEEDSDSSGSESDGQGDHEPMFTRDKYGNFFCPAAPDCDYHALIDSYGASSTKAGNSASQVAVRADVLQASLTALYEPLHELVKIGMLDDKDRLEELMKLAVSTADRVAVMANLYESLFGAGLQAGMA